jgi:hypothetical protein
MLYADAQSIHQGQREKAAAIALRHVQVSWKFSPFKLESF